ncbi:MAG: DUF2752 domain-containing protein [Polyangiales bacterium]
MTRRWLARRDRAELLAIAVLALFLVLAGAPPLVVSFAVNPDAIERGDVRLTPTCPTLARTGEPCPTCGMTRGMCAMSRARWDRAVSYNGAVPYVYFALWAVAGAGALALGHVIAEARRRRRAMPSHAPERVAAVIPLSASARRPCGRA